MSRVEGNSYANIVVGASRVPQNTNPPADSDIMQLIFMMQSTINAMQNNIAEMIKKQNSLEECVKSLTTALNKLIKND